MLQIYMILVHNPRPNSHHIANCQRLHWKSNVHESIVGTLTIETSKISRFVTSRERNRRAAQRSRIRKLTYINDCNQRFCFILSELLNRIIVENKILYLKQENLRLVRLVRQLQGPTNDSLLNPSETPSGFSEQLCGLKMINSESLNGNEVNSPVVDQ